jgi:hypothetical protein
MYPPPSTRIKNTFQICIIKKFLNKAMKKKHAQNFF